MIQKIIVTLATVTFLASCASTPEQPVASGADVPQNIDSEISFDGVSDPNEDPFFADQGTPESSPVAEAEPTPAAEETPLPAPTPEPSASPQVAVPEPVKEDTEMPQASWEMEETDPAPAPTPKPAPKAKKSAQKRPASALSGDAMRTPASDCSLREKPVKSAAKLGIASKGRKVWTENHNAEWFKVYRKQGHAFVSKTCF